jgi:outer membrane lipopolysaccharide assembly protein LptE/RlpB
VSLAARVLAAGCLLAMAGGFAGCGYRLAGQNRFLPADLRIIGIPPFDNLTSHAEIDERISEQVLDEFRRRGYKGAQAAADGAEAILQGAVTAYTTQPVAFTGRGKASRVQVIVQARAALTDQRTHAVLWRQDHFIFRGEFDVDQTERGAIDREILAIDEISREFARTLVTSILEGF